MNSQDAELTLKSISKFTQSSINSSFFDNDDKNSDTIGGIFKKGKLGWQARGSLLEIFNLRNGQKISSYDFDNTPSFARCIITCVSEINIPEINGCLLAIGILNPGPIPSSGVIAVYSVQGSKVLRCIETADRVTACHFLPLRLARKTILKIFNGCLAYGTDTGKVVLIDLCLEQCVEGLNAISDPDEDLYIVPCHVVPADVHFNHIQQHHQHSIEQNINFGIQLEAVANPSLVLSIISATPILSLVIGQEDGRMILYDLCELRAFHMAYPPGDDSPLVKLDYLEPPDDPRACCYIWAFHENPQTCIAVMHSVMYDNKIPDHDEGIYFYENFQSSSVRLTLPMYERGSIPITCQSVTKPPSRDDEETITLCLLSWKAGKISETLIFDINQWYKEQMPSIGDWRNNLSYLASFPLKEYNPLDVWIDGNTVAPFNSIQRPEEHFYPISLSFDMIVLQQKGTINLHWPGLQNRALDKLNVGGPSSILEPTGYFKELSQASLMPQFSDYTYGSDLTLNLQRDALLSIALEYNCFGLLKECAKSWADGSHLGKDPNEGLSLSTLTEWIWQKAGSIKDRCNKICIPLFDHSGGRLDQRSQKQLSNHSRQLGLLADLLEIILTKCKNYIPKEVLRTLITQHSSIKMASEYQEVLQWLLNTGLLPEADTKLDDSSFGNTSIEVRKPLVPYPYKVLRNYYIKQRMKFKKMNADLVNTRTQSCRILYIDAFIDHECNANALRDHWLESGGNGLYPPPSLQAMLRILLVPDVSIEKKYALFVYLFLDLNMVIEEERYSIIVQNLIKFPAVFKLNSSLIKTVQAFWNLDHGEFEIALEEIVSPFAQDRKLLQWQKELLIQSLLAQDHSNLALRALQAPGPPISSILELKTLLANDLIAEAFQLQRSKNDSELFSAFLTCCLYLGKWSVLLDLALNENEEKLLQIYLRKTRLYGAENLHFVYLLQRSKYIEAVAYLDELSKNKQLRSKIDLETPTLVLSAYNITMTPTTKDLSDIYYSIRNKIKVKANDPNATLSSNSAEEISQPDPLSSELLKHNADNLVGGIYHTSVLSTDQATHYWDDSQQNERNRLQNANNIPFLRRPQIDFYQNHQVKDTLSYPDTFKPVQKRLLNDMDHDDDDIIELELEQTTGAEIHTNPRKKRRILEPIVVGSTQKMSSINTTLLTQFKNRIVQQTTSDDNSIILNKTPDNNKSVLDKSAKQLKTPIVKSSRSDGTEGSLHGSPVHQRVPTPQSILKVRNITKAILNVPSPIERTGPVTRSTIHKQQENLSITLPESSTHIEGDEEKSIRFDLPSGSGNTTINTSLEIGGSPEKGEPNSSTEISQRVPSTRSVSVADNSENAEYNDNEPNNGVNIKNKSTFSGPKKRNPIHSFDSSLSTSSDTEHFFSPVPSRDTSRVVHAEEMMEVEEEEGEVDIDEHKNRKEIDEEKCVKKIIYKTYEEMDDPEDNELIMTGNEPTPTIIITETENSALIPEEKKSQSEKQINSVEGPKPRRGLRSSITPPLENIKEKKKEIILKQSTEKRNQRSRSRSKTPDNLLSTSRKSERIWKKRIEMETKEEPVQGKPFIAVDVVRTSTQKPLSRLVLEANARKSNFQITEKTVEVSESRKEIFKSKPDTIQTTTKQIQFESTSKTVETNEGRKMCDNLNESSFGEISSIDTSAYSAESIGRFSIGMPKQMLRDDSFVSDSFMKNWNERFLDNSLMTTLDMSSISGDITFEGFGCSQENLLSDSSKEDDEDDLQMKSLSKRSKDIQNATTVTINDTTKFESNATATNTTATKSNITTTTDNNKVIESSELGIVEDTISDTASNKPEDSISDTASNKLEDVEEYADTESSASIHIDTNEDSENDDDDDDIDGEENDDIDGDEDIDADEEEEDEVDCDDEERGISDDATMETKDYSSETERTSITEETNEESNDDEDINNDNVISISSSSESVKTEPFYRKEVSIMKKTDKEISDMIYGDLQPSTEENTINNQDDLYMDLAVTRQPSEEKSVQKSEKREEISTLINNETNILDQAIISNTDTINITSNDHTTDQATIIDESSELNKARIDICQSPSRNLSSSNYVLRFDTLTNVTQTPPENLMDIGEEDVTFLDVLNEAIIESVTRPTSIATPSEKPETVVEKENVTSLDVLNEAIVESVTTPTIIISPPEEPETVLEEEINIEPKNTFVPQPQPSTSKCFVVKSPHQGLQKQSLEKQSPQKQSPQKQSPQKQSSPLNESPQKHVPNPFSTQKQSPQKQSPQKQSSTLNESPHKYVPNPFSTQKQSQQKQSPQKQYSTLNESPHKYVPNPFSIQKQSPETQSPQKQLSPVKNPSQKHVLSAFRTICEQDDDSLSNDVQLKVSDDEENQSSHNFDKIQNKRKLQTPENSPKKIQSLDESISERTLRSKRARSASVEKQPAALVDTPITSRKLRASSVPRLDNIEKIKTRSSSTENVSTTPSRILTKRKSQLLDRIEENSPLDTPNRKGILREDDLPKTPSTSSAIRTTRRRSSVSSSRGGTPDISSVTPKKSREQSFLKEENITSTPRRNPRRLSVSKDTPTKEIIEDKKIKTTPLRTSSGNVKEKEHENTTNIKETTKKLENKKDNESEKTTSNMLDDYSTSRRVTRNQAAVIEKSATMIGAATAIGTQLDVKLPRRTPSKEDISDNVSEHGSVVSTRSRRSTASREYTGEKRITRSSSNRMRTTIHQNSESFSKGGRKSAISETPKRPQEKSLLKKDNTTRRKSERLSLASKDIPPPPLTKEIIEDKIDKKLKQSKKTLTGTREEEHVITKNIKQRKNPDKKNNNKENHKTTSDFLDDYSISGRVTRNQAALIKKSAVMTELVGTTLQPNTFLHQQREKSKPKDNINEQVSVQKKNKKSTTPKENIGMEKVKKSSTKNDHDEETSSIGSGWSKSKKIISKEKKDEHLGAIQEDDKELSDGGSSDGSTVTVMSHDKKKSKNKKKKKTV